MDAGPDDQSLNDPMARLAYEQARTAVAGQNDYLESLRRLAIGMAAAMVALVAVIVRELPKFPPDDNSWILAALITAFPLCCAGWTLFPHDWENTVNVEKMLARPRADEATLLRGLAKSLISAYRLNQKQVKKYQTMIRWQLAISLAAVVAWVFVAV